MLLDRSGFGPIREICDNIAASEEAAGLNKLHCLIEVRPAVDADPSRCAIWEDFDSVNFDDG